MQGLRGGSGVGTEVGVGVGLGVRVSAGAWAVVGMVVGVSAVIKLSTGISVSPCAVLGVGMDVFVGTKYLGVVMGVGVELGVGGGAVLSLGVGWCVDCLIH